MLKALGSAYGVALALGMLSAVWWVGHGLLTFHTPLALLVMFGHWVVDRLVDLALFLLWSL